MQSRYSDSKFSIRIVFAMLLLLQSVTISTDKLPTPLTSSFSDAFNLLGNPESDSGYNIMKAVIPTIQLGVRTLKQMRTAGTLYSL